MKCWKCGDTGMQDDSKSSHLVYDGYCSYCKIGKELLREKVLYEIELLKIAAESINFKELIDLKSHFRIEDVFGKIERRYGLRVAKLKRKILKNKS